MYVGEGRFNQMEGNVCMWGQGGLIKWKGMYVYEGRFTQWEGNVCMWGEV